MPNDSAAASDILLRGFDASWYVKTYPDVAHSGFDPAQHYLLFGTLMNRARNAAEAGAGRRAEPRLPEDVAALFGRRVSKATPQPIATKDADSPIIDAPVDLGPASGKRDVPPPRSETSRLPSLVLGDCILGRNADAGHLERVAGPLHLLARMTWEAAEARRTVEMRSEGTLVALAPATARKGVLGLPELVAPDFLSGPARIENAWFATTADLRLCLAGHDPAGPGTAIGTIRAWQVDPSAPGKLLTVGGMELPEKGPVFVNLALYSPLMPVLIELSDPSGATQGFALLAFPSLLRGGLHAAERAAHQLGPNPMDEVWRQSDALLRDFLDGPRDAGFAIARLAVRCTGATGAEPVFSRSLRDWLRGIFALDLTPVEQASAEDEPGKAWLAATLASGRQTRGTGLTLDLPPQAVPTLQALVSRRMGLPEGFDQAAGPFLVSDMVSNRPLWSVSLPLENRVSPDMPLLKREAGFETGTTQPERHWLAPLHLAVVCRPDRAVNEIQKLFPVAPDAPYLPKHDCSVPVTVVINVSDPDLTARALASLNHQVEIEVEEVLLRPALNADPNRIALARRVAEKIVTGRVRQIAPEIGSLADLDRVHDESGSPNVLMLDEAVALQDTRILSTLAAELTVAEDIAAVGCMLIHEDIQGKSVVQRFGSAGLFPTGISLLGAPHLTVSEPDTLKALPASTYPVLANSFALCLIRRVALEATAPARAGLAGAGSADLHFGLAARAAGWRSLCTSIVRAGTTRRRTERDQIDPFGLHCVAPLGWDELLRSVTVLRELRG